MTMSMEVIMENNWKLHEDRTASVAYALVEAKAVAQRMAGVLRQQNLSNPVLVYTRDIWRKIAAQGHIKIDCQRATLTVDPRIEGKFTWLSNVQKQLEQMIENSNRHRAINHMLDWWAQAK